MSNICIYCDKNDAISAEHILQDSLGSNWKKKGFMCPACNELFGSTIDNDLANLFLMFRNLLGIKNKRGIVPSFSAHGKDGNEYVYDGETGELSQKKKPSITVLEKDGKKMSFRTVAQIGEIQGIISNMTKKVPPDRVKEAVKLHIQDYDIIQPSEIGGVITFTPSIYVAIRKSLINYSIVTLTSKFKPNIMEEAKNIHWFANNYADTDSHTAMAKCMYIDGFPLAVDVNSHVMQKVLSVSQIANAIFLTLKEGAVYGGVVLLGSLIFGMKLFNTDEKNGNAFITVIDPLSRKKQIEKIQLTPGDFEFRRVEPDEFSRSLHKQMNILLPKCLIKNFERTVRNVLLPQEELSWLLPMKAPEVIQKYLTERVGVLLGAAFIQYTPPYFFQTGLGKIIASDTAKFFIQELRIIELTDSTYEKFVCSVWVFLTNPQHNSNFAITIKELHNLESSMTEAQVKVLLERRT